MKRQAVAVVTAFVGAAVAIVALAPSSGPRLDTFDGTPSSPLPFTQTAYYQDYTVDYHERSINADGSVDNPMEAQHGPNCEPPPATHTVYGSEDGVYQCANHIMTAINGAEYGLACLTPDSMVNISEGGVVKIDVSQADQSGRDWIDFWIVPFADTVAAPFTSNLTSVDLEGPPDNAIHIEQDFSSNKWQLTVSRDGQETNYGFGPIATGFEPSFMRRDTMQIELTQTSVRLTMPQYNQTLVDKTFPALSWSIGTFTFCQHSYSPTKDGAGQPNTWHWDNLEISDPVPFTMIHTNQRYISGTASQIVTWNEPAPANAYLRFSALGSVKVNGVSRQAQLETTHPEHANSFFVPIPEGSQSATIQLQDNDWYKCNFQQGCLAKDFVIWSQGGLPSATPLPSTSSTPLTSSPTASATSSSTPTPTRTFTSTAIPSTSTPTATSTQAPPPTTVVPSATPTPTASLMPVPSPSATPSPINCDQYRGFLRWLCLIFSRNR